MVSDLTYSGVSKTLDWPKWSTQRTHWGILLECCRNREVRLPCLIWQQHCSTCQSESSYKASIKPLEQEQPSALSQTDPCQLLQTWILFNLYLKVWTTWKIMTYSLIALLIEYLFTKWNELNNCLINIDTNLEMSCLYLMNYWSKYFR